MPAIATEPRVERLIAALKRAETELQYIAMGETELVAVEAALREIHAALREMVR